MVGMELRQLGRTNLHISAVAFGAGPVPALLVGDDRRQQTEVVAEALACGINWFDTAPTYGNGASEAALGAALADLRPSGIHIASKMRIPTEPPADLREYVLGVVRSSLQRLGIKRLSLLQLHNAITLSDNDQPSSVRPGRVLDPGGILDAMEFVRQKGLCEHLGLTGVGSAAALAEAIPRGCQSPKPPLDSQYTILRSQARSSACRASNKCATWLVTQPRVRFPPR
jgi:aryl-alcohol dehydrogenase-like predicted oxidoreductase